MTFTSTAALHLRAFGLVERFLLDLETLQSNERCMSWLAAMLSSRYPGVQASVLCTGAIDLQSKVATRPCRYWTRPVSGVQAWQGTRIRRARHHHHMADPLNHVLQSNRSGRLKSAFSDAQNRRTGNT